MANYELPTKARVLIVDDDATAHSTLAALLSSENYDLRMVSSGQEVLAYLDELKPDTILMDVMMPDMDGWRVCQQLKAQKKWRHIPIILVTALDAFETVSLKHTGVPQIGLGLAFCKMIAEAHKGRIFIEANQPRGTIFTVEI